MTAGEATPPAPRARRSWKPVLLSGLVFPGLGQLATRHYWRGLLYAAGSVAFVVVLLRRVTRETLARLPTDPTEFDTLLPFRLAHEIHRDNAPFFFWITLAVVALWAGSVADAWVSARSGATGPRRSSDPPR